MMKNRRTKQKEFRDAIVKLDELIVAGDKLNKEIENNKFNSDLLESKKALNDQKVFYLKHAESIALSNNEIPAEYEYLRMSIGFQTIGWELEAEQFIRLSIANASDNCTRAVSIRSLGRFLYTIFRHEEGKKEFMESIASGSGHDREVGFKIETYRYWALAKLYYNDADEAKRLIELSDSTMNADRRYRNNLELKNAILNAKDIIYRKRI